MALGPSPRDRVGGALPSARTFDLSIRLKDASSAAGGGSGPLVFSALSKEELQTITDFLSMKKIKLKNEMDEMAQVEAAALDVSSEDEAMMSAESEDESDDGGRRKKKPVAGAGAMDLDEDEDSEGESSRSQSALTSAGADEKPFLLRVRSRRGLPGRLGLGRRVGELERRRLGRRRGCERGRRRAEAEEEKAEDCGLRPELGWSRVRRSGE